MKPFWDLPAPEVVGRDRMIDDIALDHMSDRLRRMRAWTVDLVRTNEGPHPASLGRFVSFESPHGARCEVRMEPREARLHLSGEVEGVKAQLLLVFPSFEVISEDVGPEVPGAILDAWETTLSRARPTLVENLGTVSDDGETAMHEPFRRVLRTTAALIAAHAPEVERDVAIRLHAPVSGFAASVTNHGGKQLLRTPVERRMVADVPTAARIHGAVPDQMTMTAVEFSASRKAIGPADALATLRMLAESGFGDEADPLLPSTRKLL